MSNVGVVWFRNDLRVSDNEALTNAIKSCDAVLPIYVFDERLFKGHTKYGFRKTGIHRAKFIIESVANLKKNLRNKGSDLIVRVGIPETIISELCNEVKASWVFCNREMTYEEIVVQDALEKKLWAMGREIFYSRGKMLYYTADLPFPVLHTPDIFTHFRKEVEKIVNVRVPLESPTQIPSDLINKMDLGVIPTLEDFDFDNVCFLKESKFLGGEDAATAQLNYYLWETELLSSYKETRNGLLGWDYSSKFSAWLAVGALSPKTIYHQIKDFEVKVGANDSTYWLIFELIWRDFFRLIGKKYGNAIFKPNGVNNKKLEFIENPGLFNAWKEGETGIPFIDANMLELKHTGYMSNRGRQNVASFLVKDLHLDWLLGAEYFESMLIDYDPCSNYGNWNYIAGIGNDPREDRYFNVVSQAKKYDAGGEYVRHWIPSLKNLPNEFVHTPFLMRSEHEENLGFNFGSDYPNAIIDVAKLVF